MHDLQRLGAAKNAVDRALAGASPDERQESGEAWTLA
jgi:hypothetical protein